MNMEQQPLVNLFKKKITIWFIQVGWRVSITESEKRRPTGDFTRTKKRLLKDYLRYNEYYDMQELFDNLYDKSKRGHKFKNLIDIIVSKDNLLLAFRNIKSNKGSKTAGVNKTTIDDISKLKVDEYVEYIKNRIYNFEPMMVRRVEIPKPNGKLRPLGIPTIEDRLIQQAIKQVLEPICEARFYDHSYGFRPNRSTHHAIAYLMRKINLDKCYYIIDVDIKGFFDNVNHTKLIKQMWSLGIRDKNLLEIISKMIKAPVKGIGIPQKGTPQGGILSPLLSNIVLNELDWRICDQWIEFPLVKPRIKTRENGRLDRTNHYNTLRKSKLKEMYIVRYADDFKILCKNHKDAYKTLISIKEWLFLRLGLEVSDEKTKITNVKQHSTEFLGFKIKAFPKRKKYIIQSHICEKAKARILERMKKKIVELKKHPTCKSVGLYNATVLGIQNYFQIATLVNLDLAEIAYLLSKKLKNHIKSVKCKTGLISKVYKQRYKNNYKKQFVAGLILFPLADIKTKPPKLFNQKICNYTEEGRRLIHGNLMYINPNVIKYLLVNPEPYSSTQFNDNRLSLYAAQKGLCGISGEILKIGHMEVHHITPKEQGGTDTYKNLIYLTDIMHKLVHGNNDVCKISNNMRAYLRGLNGKQLEKLNKYRELAENKQYNLTDLLK